MISQEQQETKIRALIWQIYRIKDPSIEVIEQFTKNYSKANHITQGTSRVEHKHKEK